MRAQRTFSFIRLPLLLCLVVAPAVGVGQTSHKQNAPKQTTHRATLNARDQAFVAQATADDTMQITLAKLAMAKSSNPQLRALASRIVSDHTALNLQFARLAAATSSKGHAHGVSVQDVNAMQAHLRSLQGEAFDQAFAGMMVKEHRKIIAAYEVAAKSSADSRLKTIATRGLPVLQGHLDAARSLMKEGSPAEKRREDK